MRCRPLNRSARRAPAILLALGVAVVPVIVAAPPAEAATCTVGRPLRWASRGPDVACLESALIARGYSVRGPDQFYGVSTADAVRALETSSGMTADGVAHLDLLQALGLTASAPAPSTLPGDHGRDTSVLQTLQLGTSVQGRPIQAIERGTAGGRVVLVVGAIHGDEGAGHEVVDWLRQMPVPPGIDLWLVPSMNPDGEALGQRQNANGVDLNRNFPRKWGPLGSPGYWQYAGPGPASEPETQAMVSLLDRIRPEITLWYHQDLNEVDPAGDPAIYNTYAQYARMRVVTVTGGTYTGTATQYCYGVSPDGTAFVVELPGRVPGTMALRHASAVFASVQA
jgi:murein peptide amidase A